MLSPKGESGAMIEVATQQGVAMQMRKGPLTQAPALARELGAFDAVICSGEVGKSEQPSKVVKAVLRALKPGGVLVFAEPGIAILEALKENEVMLGGIKFDEKWADNAVAPHSLGVATA